MPTRGKIALWAFVIMMLSFSFAFSSFVRTGILQVSTSDGLSYHINMSDCADSSLEIPVITDSHTSTYHIKQLLIKTQFDEIVLYPSPDDAYHFSVTAASDADQPKLDITERGDRLSVSISRSNPAALTTIASTLEVHVPNQNLQILKIQTASGNILLKDPLANAFDSCEFNSQSGNIAVSQMNAVHFKAKSGSGNIVISSVPTAGTDLSATTGSGQIINNWLMSHPLSEEGTKLEVDMSDNLHFFDLTSGSGDITLNP